MDAINHTYQDQINILFKLKHNNANKLINELIL